MSARCARHDLARGPDGLCSMCLRDARHYDDVVKDKRARRIAKLVLAIVAGITTFALLLAVCDTKPTPKELPPR